MIIKDKATGIEHIIPNYTDDPIDYMSDIVSVDDGVEWDEDRNSKVADIDTIHYWQKYSTEMRFAHELITSIKEICKGVQHQEQYQDMYDDFEFKILGAQLDDYEYHAEVLINTCKYFYSTLDAGNFKDKIKQSISKY